MVLNYCLLMLLDQDFWVYIQVDCEWIDFVSYKCYILYVDVFELMSNEDLIVLYEIYQDEIQIKYVEIGDLDQFFIEVLIEVIDILLDILEVKMLVEVYMDLVMYKYVDECLEGLFDLQK